MARSKRYFHNRIGEQVAKKRLLKMEKENKTAPTIIYNINFNGSVNMQFMARNEGVTKDNFVVYKPRKRRK